MIELGDHHIDAVKKGISIPSRRARDEISRYFGQSAFTCRPRPSTYLAVAQQRQPTEVMPAAGVGDLSCEVFQAKAQSFGQAGREIRVAHHFVDAIELKTTLYAKQMLRRSNPPYLK